MQIDDSSVELTGVILAAGFGSRLAGVSGATELKPLTPVAGRPLMLRTLDSLAIAGCRRIVIVVGFSGDEVRASVESSYQGDLELVFVQNRQFELANGVSVLAASAHIGEHFLLTMADHVFSSSVMRLAGSHRPIEGGATLLVDYKLDAVFDMDDATKVMAENGHVVDIGKQLSSFNCVDTGLFVCTQGLVSALKAVFEERGDASLSEGVAKLSMQGRMTTLDIGDGYWQDVDTPEMLAEAERYLTELE